MKSLNKKYNDFDYRRIFVWGDFLEEMEIKYPINTKIDKELKETIEKLIKIGDEIQENLNENYLGGISFERYAKEINRYINMQDDIIKNIIDYRTEYNKYMEKPKSRREQAQSEKVMLRKVNF